MTFEEQLQKLNACPESMNWAWNKTFEQAWAECKRADWMLWLLGRVGEKKRVVEATCICARTALRYVRKDELRPLKAIEAVEKWCRDEATVQEVSAAAADAANARVAAGDRADAADAAAYATIRAACIVYAAYTTADAALYAADAAYAAARAAANSDAAGYATFAEAIGAITVADAITVAAIANHRVKAMIDMSQLVRPFGKFVSDGLEKIK